MRVIALSLIGVFAIANSSLSTKDLTIEQKEIRNFGTSLKVPKCPIAIEKSLGDLNKYKGLKSFTTTTDKDGNIKQELEYEDFKEGHELIVKMCESDGYINLNVESITHTLPNKK